MSRHPRGLSPEEAALWAKLAASVTPLHPVRKAAPAPNVPMPEPPKAPVRKAKGRVPPALPPKAAPAPPPSPAPGLDSHWERRLARAALAPDFTLDLHGHTLEQAHARLDAGLSQAKAMGARMVLLITGKPRPAASADRGEQRGAIRAKILDWLAAGPHAGDIAAVRNAHRRHGGEGALYLVLRRRR
ncbi:MAG: DNA mismatch repair protein MutS [Sphingomonadales bacterium 32-64-17]|nr:MAG: DNA mismatch repair protein MutS [Sphingomonadales bacterium 32-64-17]